MPWKALASEGARAGAAIVIAIAVAIASWQLVGKPSARQNERHTNALAYQAEARASIEEFERARPNESAALQEALDLWRDGRRRAFRGEYEAAIDLFGRATELLIEACPDCPGILVAPGT